MTATEDEGVALEVEFARAFRRLSVWCGVAALAADGSIAYRLWAQLSGSQPSMPVLRALYAVSGWLVDPFRGLDTVRSARAGPVLEFPALVALEAYLVGGVVVVGLMLLASELLRWAGSPRLEVRLQPRAYARAARRAGVAAANGALAAWSWTRVRSGEALRLPRERDWQDDRRRAVEVLTAAEAALESLLARARIEADEAVGRAQPFLEMWGRELRLASLASTHVWRRAATICFEEVRALALVARQRAIRDIERTGVVLQRGDAYAAGWLERSRLRMEQRARDFARLVTVASEVLGARARAAAIALGESALSALAAFRSFENGGPRGAFSEVEHRVTRRQFLNRMHTNS